VGISVSRNAPFLPRNLSMRPFMSSRKPTTQNKSTRHARSNGKGRPTKRRCQGSPSHGGIPANACLHAEKRRVEMDEVEDDLHISSVEEVDSEPDDNVVEDVSKHF